MAAQPIVRDSYKNPYLTYETNVMGTALLKEITKNGIEVIAVIRNEQENITEIQDLPYARIIGIEWPLDMVGGIEKLVISEKDMSLQSFKEFMA